MGKRKGQLQQQIEMTAPDDLNLNMAVRKRDKTKSPKRR
jgi:hypothetical protein